MKTLAKLILIAGAVAAFGPQLFPTTARPPAPAPVPVEPRPAPAVNPVAKSARDSLVADLQARGIVGGLEILGAHVAAEVGPGFRALPFADKATVGGVLLAWGRDRLATVDSVAFIDGRTNHELGRLRAGSGLSWK